MNHTAFDYFLLAACLALSAFFSGSEAALFSLKRSDLMRLAQSAHRRERLVGEVMAAPQKMLITLLVGNLFANLIASTLATRLFLERFGEGGQFIAIAIVTPIIIVICEVSPKSFAITRPALFARMVISPLNYFNHLFYPIREVLMRIVNGFTRALRLKLEGESGITEGELDAVLAMGESDGLIRKDEGSFIKNVLRFSKKEAQNVMTPRNQAVFVPYGAGIDEAAEIFLKTGLVRAAVYRNDLDTIVGVLDSRALVPYRMGYRKARNINRMLYSIHHYPATKELGDLLFEFLQKKIQIAVLVDEYGGTAGVVTLSSILSELLGREFSHWDDSVRPGVRRITDERSCINGDMQIDDFNFAFGEDLASTESETMGGYMVEVLEHFPERHEEVPTSKYVLRVMRSVKNRILTIEVNRKGGAL
jgi:putative hemolysin